MTADVVAELVAAAEEMLDAHTTPKPRLEDCMADGEIRESRLRTEVTRWILRRGQSRVRLRQALLDYEAASRTYSSSASNTCTPTPADSA